MEIKKACENCKHNKLAKTPKHDFSFCKWGRDEFCDKGLCSQHEMEGEP